MKTLNRKIVAQCSHKIIGAAIQVHRELGPGLLEKVYKSCLIHELGTLGLHVETEVTIPVNYKGIDLSTGLKLDLLVEDCVIVELKATQQMHSVYDAQLLSYMKLMHIPKGILFNFFCTNLVKEGMKTFVNEHFSLLDE